MEQYKVILVDDEVEVIDVMKKKIHWNDLGFDVVGSATNGVKALELVEKLQPDVVLTDIKMPYMDGLELARKLNQDYPNIYIMLCTGFDEFEYAKEAVHLEIKEYMLKPISATELSESLMKLKTTLDREREEKLNVKKLEDYFQEVLPKLQSNFFISLIEGRVREEDYERFLLDYQVDMKGPLFCCIIFHTSENDVPDGMNPLLLSMSVEREIKQRLMENCNCQEFIYMGNTILIMELHSEDEIAQLTDKCDRFCRWAWRIMGGGGYRRDRNRLQQSVRHQYFLRGSQRGGILSCPVRNETSHQYRGDRSQRVKKGGSLRRDKDAGAVSCHPCRGSGEDPERSHQRDRKAP